MRSNEAFNEFGREHLLPQLQRLERRRRSLLIKIALLSPVTLILLLIATKLPGVGIPLIYLPAVIAFIFLIFACDGLFRRYPADFKNTITQKILTFIDPSLTYSARCYIAKKDFKQCNLFDNHIERYEGSDLIQGRIGQTDIQFSFIHADHSKNDNESNIFRGLFMIIDMNKDFRGQTLVYPNYAERYLGGLGKILNRMTLRTSEPVQLENPTFNQAFLVYSSHPVEARYILTPDLMERLLALGDTYKPAPCFSFTASKVYIAMGPCQNRINPKIFSNMTDFDTCCKYFDELQKIIGIVDDLNLNTRIWSKE